jgi:AsmA protein
MNLFARILLAALAGVVLIFIAIAVAVTFVFEPNDYRPLVVESVRSATGRDFALDGDLELELFPCCSVSVGSASLGNPPDFPQTSFASIESGSVSLKIWPLLTRREVQIGQVTLHGVNVQLTELAGGRANWEFETGETESQSADEHDAPLGSLTIDGLRISNGNVAYRGADGALYSATDILIDAGAMGGATPVPVALKLTATDERTDTTAEIELNGVVGLGGELLTLEEPHLSLRAGGAMLPTGEARADITASTLRYHMSEGTGAIKGLNSLVYLPGTRIEVTGDIELAGTVVTGNGEINVPEGNIQQLLLALPDPAYTPAGPDALKRLTGGARWSLTSNTAAMSDLQFNLDGSTITGSVGVTSFKTPGLTANLSIDRLNMDDYLPNEAADPASGDAAEPTEVPFESLAAMPLDASVNIGKLASSGITVRDLAATLSNDGRDLSIALESDVFGGHLMLNGSGNLTGSSPVLAGQLQVDGISPRAALTELEQTVETANPNTLAHLSGSTRWRIGRRSLTLDGMSWQLDETRFTGSFGIDDFDTPATHFDLAVDRIALDDYLAPDPDEEAKDDTDLEVPAELIRGLDLTGHLTAGAIRVMDLDVTNLKARVSAKNGVLTLEPLVADLYTGIYRGGIVIDASGAVSRLSLDQQISAVQIGPVLSALAGSDRIAGALSLNLTGSGEGNTQSELLKGLTGDLSFSLKDGVYHGMDIAYEIENAQSLLNRSASPVRPNHKETPIKALSFSGKMVEGVLGTEDLMAEIPFLKLGGTGGVNLLAGTLDYQLATHILRSADDVTESRFAGLGGSTIPLTITGSMADPKVGVNLQGLVVETVKERARNELFKHLGITQDQPPGTGGGESDGGAVVSSADTGPSESQPAAATAPDVPDRAIASQPANPGGMETEATSELEDTREEQAAEPPSTRELIEFGLRGLLRNREAKSSGDDSG